LKVLINESVTKGNVTHCAKMVRGWKRLEMILNFQHRTPNLDLERRRNNLDWCIFSLFRNFEVKTSLGAPHGQ
jgi:hypothetical protein